MKTLAVRLKTTFTCFISITNTNSDDLEQLSQYILSSKWHDNQYLTVFFLHHFAQHRAFITCRKLTFMDFVHFCLNHLDFFTPLVPYTISVLPIFVYYILHPYHMPIATRKTGVLGLVLELVWHFSHTSTLTKFIEKDFSCRHLFAFKLLFAYWSMHLARTFGILLRK